MKESVLLSQIELIRVKWESDPASALGICSQSRWQGTDQVSSGQKTWRVAQCDSVLELRQRLCEESTLPLVLITALPTSAVGDDVRARLFKQQLLLVDPWNTLAERFKARQVDPVLRQSAALADVALDALGNKEPDVAASGILTVEAIWKVILLSRLGLDSARPDLLDFLPWMTTEGASSRWAFFSGSLQKPLESWLSLSLGELAPVLFRCLADGHGPDALALGFVVGALMGASSDSRAMGRLERFTGNQPLTGTLAQRWNEACERWASLQGGGEPLRSALARADQILESVGAAEFAIQSRWSPLGFQMRLAVFGEALAKGDGSKCQSAYKPIALHEGARFLEELRGRRERAEMAMRLTRWMGQPQALAETLTDAVSRYEQDGCWVDWARQQLLAGDEPEGVSRAYRRLFDKVTARREQENRRFGELLAASTASDSPASGVLLMEEVLAKVVAPLTKQPVLLIVMDGMSLPVWRELAVDLGRHGWLERSREGEPSVRSALTVLPSATQYSRASLLCGKLTSGTQSVEKKGFQNPSGSLASKPILFHKDEVGSSGADLSEAVRVALAKSDVKLVGVVLNVIDDSLSGPEQLSIQWNLRSIAVLQTLLGEAKSAGRVVIMASDHGHVLDHGSQLTRKTDSADRWRPVVGEGDANPEEMLVSGRRVLADGGRMIAPTAEKIRYTPNRLGYHGGLTPQECIAPLAVLAPALMEIAGWEVNPSSPPDWWFEDETLPVAVVPAPRKSGKPRLPLFDAPSSEKGWIDALLASEMFAQQMATFGGRLKTEQVEQYLRVLAERNLVLLKTAFAQKLGVSLLRVDGLVASLQRILNVESYPVLSVDASQTVRLNLELLRQQFELGESRDR